jgi:hypothetical protein
MSYALERFGSLTLPTYNPVIGVGTGKAVLQLLPLPGGSVFDVLGDEQADVGLERIKARYRLVASSGTDLQSDFNDIKALIGKRDKLYRRQADDEVEWIYARLEDVIAKRSFKDFTNTLDIDLIFAKISENWNGESHGAVWYLDAGEYFDTGLYFDVTGEITLDVSPKSITVNNGGNADVKNCILTITAGSAAITALEIERRDSGDTTTFEHLDYNGTIAIGDSLVIDCGAFTIENDGVDDYDNLDLGSSHQTDDWFNLIPGNNTIRVTKTGGSTDSTILFTFSDGLK